MSGVTTVQAGTLRLAGAGLLGQSAPICVETGATLDLSDVTGAYEVPSTHVLRGDGRFRISPVGI